MRSITKYQIVTILFLLTIFSFSLCSVIKSYAVENGTKDVVQLVVNDSIEELKVLLSKNEKLPFKDRLDHNDLEIAAQVALLYNKNDFLEEFLKKGVFPHAHNFLKLEDIQRLKNPTVGAVKKIIEKYNREWDDGGVEGDCGTFSRYENIQTISPKQFELILRYNKDMCSGELMCGATTIQLIGGDKKKEKIYYKICR